MEESEQGLFAEWEIHKQRLKKEYPQLSEEDLHYETGKESETLLRLAEKLKKTQKEIRDWLSIMG